MNAVVFFVAHDVKNIADATMGDQQEPNKSTAMAPMVPMAVVAVVAVVALVAVVAVVAVVFVCAHYVSRVVLARMVVCQKIAHVR